MIFEYGVADDIVVGRYHPKYCFANPPAVDGATPSIFAPDRSAYLFRNRAIPCPPSGDRGRGLPKKSISFWLSKNLMPDAEDSS